LEQQLTGQSVLIPQAGDVLLPNGQLDGLRATAGHCACDLQAAKAIPPAQPEVSQLASTEEAPRKVPNARPDPLPPPVDRPAAKEEPIYQVFMPPLIYDANAKVQPEIDSRMIVLVRRVRVRPTLLFQGRVAGVTAATATPAPSVASNAPKTAAPAGDSFVNRVRSFVRKLWPSGS
jgi:hypothetical protein